jgi:hypothetical protein
MKPLPRSPYGVVLLACLVFAGELLAAETAARRRVGRPPTQVLGSKYISNFFPPDFIPLETLTLQPGEIRIRIVHQNLRRSTPTPSSEGIAAEIRGRVGANAMVTADHDHHGFSWQERRINAEQFRDLVAIVFDESFLATKPVKPFSMGAHAFHIEVATPELYGNFHADFIGFQTEERGLVAFRRVVAAVLAAAGFREEEIFWGATSEETADVQRSAAEEAARAQAVKATIKIVCRVDGDMLPGDVAAGLSAEWGKERELVLEEYPRGFETRVAVRYSPTQGLQVDAIEHAPKDATRRAIEHAVANTPVSGPARKQLIQLSQPVWLTFQCRKLPTP